MLSFLHIDPYGGRRWCAIQGKRAESTKQPVSVDVCFRARSWPLRGTAEGQSNSWNWVARKRALSTDHFRLQCRRSSGTR